jgi:hypothetical protein
MIEYLAKKGDIKFKHYKVLTSVAIVVLLMIPMVLFYTFIVSDSTKAPTATQPIPFDWLQMLFYGFTMLACIYAFCLSNLDLDYESYADLDNAEVVRLKKSVPETGAEDSRNNKI